MTGRDVNAEELGRLADVLHAIASVASAYPERTAVESAATVIAGEMARRPSSVRDIAARTGLPAELIWKIATPSLTDDGLEWADRIDTILFALVEELLGKE